MDDIKNRIIQFVRYLGISVSEFERICGFTRNTIAYKKGELGSSKLATILMHYPELNFEWVLFGQGDMFKKEVVKKPENSSLIEYLEKKITEKDIVIGELNRTIGSLQSNHINHLNFSKIPINE